MICPNDDGVLVEGYEDGVSVGLRRDASPDHFCYGTSDEPPAGAFVINRDRGMAYYCLACGDEDCRAEHTRNVAKYAQRNRELTEALKGRQPSLPASAGAGARGRLSALAD
jgi:hypothetical protein